MALSVVILAAGRGTRMKSEVPKVLHTIAGLPMLTHVINTAKACEAADIFVIYGHGGQQVQEALAAQKVTWVHQKQTLGTGHAVAQALPHLKATDQVLVLLGDVPMISKETITRLRERTPKDAIGWLTAHVKNPTGFGRIVRDSDNNPVQIVEEKDATDLQKTIDEINTGICLVPAKYLKDWLPKLKRNNSQKEYYLTDIFSVAVQKGVSLVTVSPESLIDIQGVNDRIQQAQLERAYQARIAENLMRQGATLLSPDRIDVRGHLTIANDVKIDVNAIFEGEVTLGAHCYIGPNVYLKNTTVGKNVIIKANSVVEDAIIADDCEVGPFARIRPGTKLAKGAKIGNFVETKNADIGAGSKVSHLSYIGDAKLGKDVNIGAGTITCNYDGANKHQTTLGDDVFIGSNTALVAPLKVSKGATVGAGSVITKDVSANELALTRAKQTNIKGWKRPKKNAKG